MSSEPQRYYRQYVKFSFFRVTPEWRLLDVAAREATKSDFQRTVESFGDRLMIRSYSTMGTRGDTDFLLWQIGDRMEDIQHLTTALFSTKMAPYLEMPYSYLAMTRRSTYDVKDEPHDPDARLIIRPTNSRYFFVYPFVKMRAWYNLSQEQRQEMMNEHIRIGRKYPSVKLNTTYSFGLDDQEFVVAFETDEPANFLDLVMELRETEGSLYTLRDTPIFSCIAMPLRETLDSLGMAGQPAESPAQRGWTRIAAVSELPPGERTVAYLGGEQVALLNVEGRLFAFGNRCPHANTPLTEGCLEGTTLTCAAHNSQFDIETGQPLGGPASRPLVLYAAKVEDGDIFLAPLS